MSTGPLSIRRKHLGFIHPPKVVSLSLAGRSPLKSRFQTFRQAAFAMNGIFSTSDPGIVSVLHITKTRVAIIVGVGAPERMKLVKYM